MKKASLSLSAAAGLIASANAASIGINLSFDETGWGGSYPTGMNEALTQVGGNTAGIISQGNWNDMAITPSSGAKNLSDANDDSGIPTTLDLTLNHVQSSAPHNTPSAYSTGTPDGNERLFNHGVFLTAATGATSETSITATEIPYSIYDVYLYVGKPQSNIDGRSWTFTLGSTSYNIGEMSGKSYSGEFIDGSDSNTTEANYLKFSGVTGTSFTVTSSASAGRETLSGLQIVEAVPEPGSALLFTLASLVSLRRRR